MSAGTCRKCREPLVRGRRFCGSCGHPSPAEVRAHGKLLQRRSRADGGAMLATAVLFIGALLTILFPMEALVDSRGVASLLRVALFAGVACAGALCLGRSSFRKSWGENAQPRWFAIAFGLGLVGFAISYGYVAGLDRLFGGEGAVDEGERLPLAFLVLDVVLITAVIEEWLCRGVLWLALERIAGNWVVILLTAFLFALLHSFNGLLVFEWPHRFALGLICGWLRYRSGSLWPGVVAHMVNNALAVLVDRV